MGQRVLVCGGRDYLDQPKVFRVLHKVHGIKPIDMLIVGDALGADAFAYAWAMGNDVPVQMFRADWARHGRSAGPIRNQRMIDEGKPDCAVAFKGGRGTADMVARLIIEKIKVLDEDVRPLEERNPRAAAMLREATPH